MREIPRHEIDVDFAARQVTDLEDSVDRAIPRLERFPRRLSGLLDTSLMRMQYHCAVDPAVNEGMTWEDMVLSMQVSSAIFAAAARTDGEVECRVHTATLRIPATGPQYWTTAGTWLTALWLAMICREKERTDMLCDTSLDLLRASGAQYDDYVYPWIESLQMYWHGDVAYYTRLAEAVKGTDPELLHVASDELVLLLLFPPIKMFGYLSQREDEKFNEALAEALDLHRGYWTTTADRAADPDGYVALAPTALAAFAHEKGITIDVESDYMPKNLVTGAWVGEFTT